MATFGKTDQGSLSISFNNDLYASRYKITEPGEVTSITAWMKRSVAGGNPTVKFAIYSDPDGKAVPTNMILIAETAEVSVTNTSGAEFTANFATKPILAKNGFYYLVFIGEPASTDTVSIFYDDTSANGVRTLTFDFDVAFTATWTPDSGFTRDFSIYATYTAVVGPTEGSFSVNIDWNNDGDFEDTGEDVTADVRLGAGFTMAWERGADAELEEAATGTLSFALKNATGTYSPENTSSPLNPNVLPYRPVRVQAAHLGIIYDLFAGFIEKIVPHPGESDQYADVFCVDRMDQLERRIIEAPRQGTVENIKMGAAIQVSGVNITFNNANPDTIVRASGSFVTDGFQVGMRVLAAGSVSNDGSFVIATIVALTLTLDSNETLTAEGPSSGITLDGYGPVGIALDEGGWPTGLANRALDRGVDTLDVWWNHKKSALQALRDLGRAESSFLYVNGAGKFVYEDRHHRLGSDIVLVSGINITFNNANPDTIVRASGNFVTDGFVAGMKVTADGSASNDGTFTVANVVALTLTLIASETLTAEGPSSGITIYGSADATDHLTSQATFSNTMADMGYEFSVRSVRNVIHARGQKLTALSQAYVWETQDTPSIAALSCATLEVWAELPNPATGIVVPVANTDWKANTASNGTGTDKTSSVAIVGVRYGQSLKMTLTNNTSPVAKVFIIPGTSDPDHTLRIQAKEFESNPIFTSVEDATSKTAFGERALDTDIPFKGNFNDLLSFAQYQLARQKQPQPNFSQMLVTGGTDALKTQILARKLSDRITVTEDDLGISSQDYFINKARWRVSEGGLWIEVLWSIARIEIDNEVFWILGKTGYSELGQTTILPF